MKGLTYLIAAAERQPFQLPHFRPFDANHHLAHHIRVVTLVIVAQHLFRHLGFGQVSFFLTTWGKRPDLNASSAAFGTMCDVIDRCGSHGGDGEVLSKSAFCDGKQCQEGDSCNYRHSNVLAESSSDIGHQSIPDTYCPASNT